ncbi:MAG: circularly permuted type 2 ATP-grasp protein [Gammaproteobacteria bacterium]
MNKSFCKYLVEGAYDELLTASGNPRASARALVKLLKQIGPKKLAERRAAAELAIKGMGITFTVYSEGTNIDREWPFDIIPRIISEKEWRQTEAGLTQRLTALNMFIDDLYNERRVIKDKILPADLLAKSKNFREQCRGVKPLHGTWAHICGTDLIRDKNGRFLVLEDNLRVPSGVSYMLQNRNVTKRVFPELFEHYQILPVDDYPNSLFDTLASISPRPLDFPEVVVLTPGIYNSAYFEHAYLAQRMGAELVEGSDLMVDDDDCVYMKTVEGLAPVDVIYRRIDDEFLDPEVFNKESTLGVPGLMRAWKAGNVGIANAPGAGVADDKIVYTFVPELIKYYLDQDAILPNVESYICSDPVQRKHVLSNLENLVVKPANESGGYGMLIGPKSTKKQRAEFARLINAKPRDYMAQPVINLSTVPTLCDDGIESRHVDLRPFTLQGLHSRVTPGGLTRVALPRDSLVVNSSQGGGSKDTWVVADSEA